jgi:hypothetical protein
MKNCKPQTLPHKIISGGQTGADMGGLFGAIEAGIPTGGTAPKGWLTEIGPRPILKKYGLAENPVPGYPARTRRNIIDSDGTVLFYASLNNGTKLTRKTCIELGKPYIENPSPSELRDWVRGNGIRVLNVAGNRESGAPGMQDKVHSVVKEAFTEVCQ